MTGRMRCSPNLRCRRRTAQKFSNARVVFAVEPCATLRRYVREEARRRRVDNLYVLDGFLDAIPLPAASADILLTCQAIGWSLPDELAEIERIVRPGGEAMHLFGTSGAPGQSLDEHLIAAGYASDPFEREGIRMQRYLALMRAGSPAR